jgi:acetyl/propionyl-CoA carboxylase alpha subunit
MFTKILIANRGEIACRVMRTARALGYRTVAVYSDADASAPHVQQADEAVRIGPSPAAESYLNITALLAAARASGADAVHPGYGFLSERADFAQACADAGLVFIGPPPAAIQAMGDKAGAKRRMLAAGVPCAPGYLGEDQSEARLQAEAAALGLPLLVKAVAGGGGRGIRLLRSAADLAALPAALASARREAESAFGDGTLMLERLIEHGRHIEVQVFADAHGHCIHLGERDCTAQRRRQKLIEESPSPVVDADLRAAMGRDAVHAALAVGYVGAGTVEFIVDAQLQHHFLEMNTRLQVEHPVTELVTGLDLVEWQLRVAAGEPLPLTQEQVRFSGHAIEARLCAEDPYAGWAPQTGRVLHWQPRTALHAGVRIDHGLAEGSELTPYYDAMVAKLIVHGRDRADALRRLAAALEDTPLVGPLNNGRFLRDLLRHPRFVQAQMTTTLLDEWAAQEPGSEPLLQRPEPDDTVWALAAALRAAGPHGHHADAAATGTPGFDLTLQCQGQRRTLRSGGGAVELLSWRGREVRYSAGGVQRRALAVVERGVAGDSLHIAVDGAIFSFGEPSPYPAADLRSDPGRACAPVAGVVVQLRVAVGDVVAAGQQLLCVEAMKMEMWLHAAAAGTVRAVHAAAKDSVAAGALLVELEITP